jgi:protein-tyrosine-phosphatase
MATAPLIEPPSSSKASYPLDPRGLDLSVESLQPGFTEGPQPVAGMSTRLERLVRVLFLCTHNRARSQMAEGLLRHLTGGTVWVASAGTVATRVHPLAIAVMAERGIDISGQRSKQVDEFAGEDFDFVITVCDNARESCPLFPGEPEQIHWSIPDPSAVEGDEEEKLLAFRGAAEELLVRIRHLLILIENKRG